MADDCRIRTMARHEVDDVAIEFAAREGWNPGLHDAGCFFEADTDGFLVAEVGGQPIGCISAVSYGDGFGFIGLYIVAPEWRGKGIGWRLWSEGMARLQGRLVGLDGVVAQQDNYRKSGFRLAWRNVRYAGVARHDASDTAGIVPLAEVDFAAVCADDRRVFPAPRERFLRAWIDMPEASALGRVDGGKLTGWGVIRRCREGHKIGPLVADTPDIAASLYAALCARVREGDAVFLDVPQPNADAVALAERERMRGVFETARMYTGEAPACELPRVYGVTTFELG